MYTGDKKKKHMTELKIKGKAPSWLLPVALGVILVTTIGVIYRVTKNRIPRNVVKEAESLDVDPARWNDMLLIDKKLFAKQALTDEEWRRYTLFATGSDVALKEMAARHIFTTIGTSHESESRAILNRLADDPNITIRASALISLREFHDPSWKNRAFQLQRSSDKHARGIATALLKKGEKQ